MVNGSKQAFFFFRRECGDIFKPLEHSGIFEQVSLFVLSEQITDRCIQEPGEFFSGFNGRDHLITFILADGGMRGTLKGFSLGFRLAAFSLFYVNYFRKLQVCLLLWRSVIDVGLLYKDFI